jgi:hypothetical protein
MHALTMTWRVFSSVPLQLTYLVAGNYGPDVCQNGEGHDEGAFAATSSRNLQYDYHVHLSIFRLFLQLVLGQVGARCSVVG